MKCERCKETVQIVCFVNIVILRFLFAHSTCVLHAKQSDVFLTWQKSKEIQMVKYARIQVFSNMYFSVRGQNLRFCPYTGDYTS